MLTTLPEDVKAFADSARPGLERLGGAQFALAAERDDELRQRAGRTLEAVGALDLDVRADAEQFLAGAALCRLAGAVTLPWPVVDVLLGRDGVRLALTGFGDGGNTCRVDHGDLGGDWVGCELDGSAYRLETGRRDGGKLGPFLATMTTGEPAESVAVADISRHLVLGAWRILGALEAAISQVVTHVKARTQFGQPLAEFQTIRFRLADTTVALRGLEESAKFSSWRLHVAPDSEAYADAIAVRLQAVDTARAVLRTAHQLHGAVGFCDETDVSVINRHLQPALCLPATADQLAARLADCVSRNQLVGLFT